MHFFFRGLGDSVRLTGKNETVYGLWNKTAGGNNTVAAGSNYDVGLTTTIVANIQIYGVCNESIDRLEYCANIGFYLT
jgi:hypothetical protein